MQEKIRHFVQSNKALKVLDEFPLLVDQAVHKKSI